MAPADYTGPVATDFPMCLDILQSKVKPERDRNKRKARRERWWQYAERAPSLYRAVTDAELLFGIPVAATKYVAFAPVHKGTVYSHSLAIIVLENYSMFAALSSDLHDSWARQRGSYNLSLLRYTPTDCFETFPFPSIVPGLEDVGKAYCDERHAVMVYRGEGLTKTYNRFHNPQEAAEDIRCLRELHVQMNHAVAAAYGWEDLDLGHGFHETKQGVRYTLHPEARREVLGRLLKLNHERYAEEVAAGLHEKKRGKKKEARVEGGGDGEGLLKSGRRSLFDGHMTLGEALDG